MIEVVPFEEATVEKLSTADVIMTMGYGDPQSPRVLVGRAQFVQAATNKETAAQTTIFRVKIANDEEFEEFKSRVAEAKGSLDEE